jgi:uncharacterized membrane-anchored protein YhcB (DUF1043 family)
MDFDWSEIAKVLSYLIPIIIFILFNVVFKKQREKQRQLGVVKSLLSETEYNSNLVDSFSMRSQMKNFKTATWKRNRDKMDYIDQSLYSTLADAYEIADGFNREIDAAKKHKSASYIAGINVSRLTKPLAKSKQGLKEWLELNKSKKKSPLDNLKPKF